MSNITGIIKSIQFFFLLNPRLTIPVFFGTLPFKPLIPVAVVADSTAYLLGVWGLSFEPGDGLFIEKPVLEKSVTLDFSIGCGFSLFNTPINYDGFGKVVFFLELGLTFISGKKD